MTIIYAKEFSEIHSVLRQNHALQKTVIRLINEQPIAGKVTEGGNRLTLFKEILKEIINGELTPIAAYLKVEEEIPRRYSAYANNNRVFPIGWAERLVRTQLSRFYNQAVMETLISAGQIECFIPHSNEEQSDSNCSLYLAGKKHNIQLMLSRLTDSYGLGNWNSDLKIPEHPHCTHVICPI